MRCTPTSATRRSAARSTASIAPLLSELQNGDEVEIITLQGADAPPAAWESLVVTGKARAAIRRATRAAVRKQYAGLGRRIVERAFERAKSDYSDEKLQGALPRLARASIEDVLAAVGRGEMCSADVVRAMYPDYKEERVAAAPAAEGGERLVRAAKGRRRVKFKVPGPPSRRAARSRSAASTATCRCASRPTAARCRATASSASSRPGEGITIYPIQSPALKEFDDQPERWLDVRWDIDERDAAALSGADRGAVGQRAGHARADRPGDRRARRQHRQHPHGRGSRRISPTMTIDLEVYDLKHLNAIIAQLRAKDVVATSSG